jgi:hypothetical protein
MSQENVELVRSIQDDWNRGDTTVDSDKVHPDLEFLPLRAATEGAYRGLLAGPTPEAAGYCAGDVAGERGDHPPLV